MSSDGIHTYLITYDVSSDSLRDKISTRILRSGRRLQYSVFIVLASKVVFAELHRDLLFLSRNGGAHIVSVKLGSGSSAESRITEYGEPLVGDGEIRPWHMPKGWKV
ncbi:MAG: CRISPR-associated endonuclease Cas2 [Spirochaetes bacterium]|jgi:CRISPR-associated endonuclease Cas2|nr:MAG: CRISPR-associated endonuclease Cas2 [Spirochaetota bacterium]